MIQLLLSICRLYPDNVTGDSTIISGLPIASVSVIDDFPRFDRAISAFAASIAYCFVG